MREGPGADSVLKASFLDELHRLTLHNDTVPTLTTDP